MSEDVWYVLGYFIGVVLYLTFLVIIFWIIVVMGYYSGKYIAMNKNRMNIFNKICLYIGGFLWAPIPFLLGRFNKKYDANGVEIKEV